MVTTSIGGALVVVARSRRIPTSPRCFYVTANSDLLRSQLDRLHAEAESTRVKANSNRLRLLRLSEAAENLRKQAAVNVQTGKENDARELLLQKKKVMQALDKAKARIELLDTLSSKLNEAISVKETQLIGNISLDLEEDGENSTSGGIHIVSPKPKSTEDGHENDHTHLDSEGSQLIEKNFEDYQELLDNHVLEDVSTGSILKEVSSYESFLESLDQKLSRIEAELVTVVNVASLVLNHEDKPKNLKVQQSAEILEEIRRVRER
ncbi:unnamed protein product [Arabidopsis arenosa]|uniref:Uncharacterized protein n=1 Tax=Arabidopsis arenosa TaxID=38785 RepID=A0A8S1ZC52_ARAAE|nr:unnamed protein product [Arabidopsis arenosa]